MKHLTITLIALSILLSVTKTNAQVSETAVEYMTKVVTPLNSTSDETWQYLKAITRGKGARKVEAKRQQLIAEMQVVKANVKRVGPYNGDDQLVNAVVTYLELSDVVLREDFAKILDMEDIAEQSYDLMEAYLLAKEKASEKLQSSFEVVKTAQNTFAAANNITLIDGQSNDKQSLKIKEAGEALSYYNDLYLIFFKVYKQEAYTLDAMSRNDITAFEQTKSSLATTAAEGLQKIDTVKSYKADATLKLGVQKIITFYKKEAEVDFQQQTIVFMQKDNFNAQKKVFDAIPEKKRTQKDVDEFNKAVNEYNEAIKKGNATIQATNAERNKTLKLWNDTVEQFFKTHTN
jgi:hypothetical protein